MQSLIVHIKDAKILNTKAVRLFFDIMKDGKHFITAKHITRRSTQQNSYIHVLFSMLLDPLRNAGWENIKNDADVKDFVKQLFLSVKVTNEKTGEIVTFVKRTRDLSREETQVLISEIHQWASEYLNVYLPDPMSPIKLFNQ